MSATTAIGDARKGFAQAIRAFYARPVGWLALIVTSVVLAYVGGGAMFWFHAIYRGEAGPQIADRYHWAFDSTLGFLALTPVLFFILPGVLWAVDRTQLGASRAKPAVYVALVGVLFGVLTGPGPLMHDALVGRDAPLGRFAVSIFGENPEVAARVAHEHSMLSEVVLQVLVGVPVYIVAALGALGIVRAVAARRRRG